LDEICSLGSDEAQRECLESFNASDPWGKPYRLERDTRSSYRVRSAGADDEFGTRDDLLSPDPSLAWRALLHRASGCYRWLPREGAPDDDYSFPEAWGLSRFRLDTLAGVFRTEIGQYEAAPRLPTVPGAPARSVAHWKPLAGDSVSLTWSDGVIGFIIIARLKGDSLVAPTRMLPPGEKPTGEFVRAIRERCAGSIAIAPVPKKTYLPPIQAAGPPAEYIRINIEDTVPSVANQRLVLRRLAAMVRPLVLENFALPPDTVAWSLSVVSNPHAVGTSWEATKPVRGTSERDRVRYEFAQSVRKQFDATSDYSSSTAHVSVQVEGVVARGDQIIVELTVFEGRRCAKTGMFSQGRSFVTKFERSGAEWQRVAPWTVHGFPRSSVSGAVASDCPYDVWPRTVQLAKAAPRTVASLDGASAVVTSSRATFLFPRERDSLIAWDVRRAPGAELDRGTTWTIAWNYLDGPAQERSILLKRSSTSPVARRGTVAELLKDLVPTVLYSCDEPTEPPSCRATADSTIRVTVERQRVVVRIEGSENIARIFSVVPDSVTLVQSRRDHTSNVVRVKVARKSR